MKQSLHIEGAGISTNRSHALKGKFITVYFADYVTL